MKHINDQLLVQWLFLNNRKNVMIKMLFILCASLFLISTLTAQVPSYMSYQAIARDENGDCLENQMISLQVSIIGDTIDGPVVFKERFENSVATNRVGHFQVKLGSGTPQHGGEVDSLHQIYWNNRKHFLKVEYALDASSIYTEVGTTELLSVPYAQVSGNGKLYSLNNQDEYLPIYGTNGGLNVVLGGRSVVENGGANYGSMLICDEENDVNIHAFSTASGGWMFTRGPNIYRNVELSVFSSDEHPNRGVIRIRNEEDITKVWTGVKKDGAGFLNLLGPNNEANIFLGNRDNNPDRGALTIRDENGEAQVSLYVDDNGNGYVEADGASGGVKAFVMPHPHHLDKDIVYACIEGPEAAAYDRGTAELINGEAFIPFSETFGIVANSETMTIMTSPWSIQSKGLAVVERTESGFRVKELSGGTGNYRFDWEVKAVRKGWENFEVIRDNRSVDDETHEQYRDLEDPIIQHNKK